MCILHIVFCTVCKYVLSICKLFVLFFCTVWSTLIRISLTKALVLWWCDNKKWFDLKCLAFSALCCPRANFFETCSRHQIWNELNWWMKEKHLFLCSLCSIVNKILSTPSSSRWIRSSAINERNGLYFLNRQPNSPFLLVKRKVHSFKTVAFDPSLAVLI